MLDFIILNGQCHFLVHHGNSGKGKKIFKTTGIKDTGGNLPRVHDTGAKFAASVNDTGGR